MSNKLWDLRRVELRKVLRELRQESGVTQQELAKRLRKPQSYISKYESGERRIDLIEIQEVCDSLQVPLMQLITRYLTATEGMRNNYSSLVLNSL